MSVPRPQDTGCTTIKVDSEGVANGLLSMVADYYDVVYDEHTDQYFVYTEDAERPTVARQEGES